MTKEELSDLKYKRDLIRLSIKERKESQEVIEYKKKRKWRRKRNAIIYWVLLFISVAVIPAFFILSAMNDPTYQAKVAEEKQSRSEESYTIQERYWDTLNDIYYNLIPAIEKDYIEGNITREEANAAEAEIFENAKKAGYRWGVEIR